MKKGVTYISDNNNCFKILKVEKFLCLQKDSHVKTVLP